MSSPGSCTDLHRHHMGGCTTWPSNAICKKSLKSGETLQFCKKPCLSKETCARRRRAPILLGPGTHFSWCATSSDQAAVPDGFQLASSSSLDGLFHRASFKSDANAYTCVSDRVFLGTPDCFGRDFKLCTRLRMCGAVHDLDSESEHQLSDECSFQI